MEHLELRSSVAHKIRRDIDAIALMEEAMRHQDQEIADVQERMLRHATERLITQGLPAAKAREMATNALNAPADFPIPTLDELDG